MTLKEIRYLLAVARCNSISEAAKQLYVAQPSLTHAIQTVEKEVGFRIFERSRNGVIPTCPGEELLVDIRNVYEQMQLVQSKYVEKLPEKQSFSVSTQHLSMAAEPFMHFVRELQEPYYDARFFEGNLESVIEEVSSGHSKIGFIHFTEEKEQMILKKLQSEKLEFYTIRWVKPCLLMREGHLLAEKETIQVQDLLDYPEIFYDSGMDDAVCFTAEEENRHRADRRLVISDGIMLLQLLSKTDACTVSLPFHTELFHQNHIISRSLPAGRSICLGWIKKPDTTLSRLDMRFLRTLNAE